MLIILQVYVAKLERDEHELEFNFVHAKDAILETGEI